MNTMPEVFQLRKMLWQLFVTLTFRAILNQCRNTALVFAWLRDVAHWNQIHFRRVIWVARFELTVGGRPHFHLCVAGLPEDHATARSCREYAVMWHQRAGFADVQLYDSARDGVGYVLKRLTPNGVRAEDEYPPMLSDSLLDAARRRPCERGCVAHLVSVSRAGERPFRPSKAVLCHKFVETRKHQQAKTGGNMNKLTIDEQVNLEIHPAAKEFPQLKGKEFEELKEDIRLRGLVKPLIKKGNVLLDGRNRLRACQDLGIEPEFEEYLGEDAVGLIISCNIHRRHLTDDQRAATLAKLHGLRLRLEGDARMKAGVAVVLDSTQGLQTRPGKAYEQLAEEGKISPHRARAALHVEKYTPSLLDDVIAGKVKLAQAAKLAKARRLEARQGHVKKELTLQERVEKKFLRLMQSFTVQEYPKARNIIRDLVALGGRDGN